MWQAGHQVAPPENRQRLLKQNHSAAAAQQHGRRPTRESPEITETFGLNRFGELAKVAPPENRQRLLKHQWQGYDLWLVDTSPHQRIARDY